MTKATEQARYVRAMACRLAERVEARELLKDKHGTIPAYYGKALQVETAENIDRMIVQLRAELLELRRLAV